MVYRHKGMRNTRYVLVPTKFYQLVLCHDLCLLNDHDSVSMDNRLLESLRSGALSTNREVYSQVKSILENGNGSA